MGDTSRFGQEAAAPAEQGSERLAAWLLGWPATVATAGLCLALLVGWAPHYVLWPWWTDLDCYSTMAQAWDAGERPYRDITSYNFPGQIYVFYALGKLFGWGRTAPIYVFDVMLLLGLGVMLVLWSRRLYGTALPGFVGLLSFLSIYTDLGLREVAQRDWHQAAFAVMGLLVLQAWPGRVSLVVSGMLFALALVFRPYAVLLMPAAVWIIVSAGGETGASWSWQRATGDVLIWGMAIAAFALVGFSPLIAQGLIDDLLQGSSGAAVGEGYGARLSFATRAVHIGGLATRDTRLLLVPLALLILAPQLGRVRGIGALSWPVVIGGSFIAYVIAPIPHSYLRLPAELGMSVGLGAVLGGILVQGPWRSSTKLAVLCLAVVLAFPAKSSHLKAGYSQAAVAAILKGERLRFDPSDFFSPADWRDYQDLLDYLRRQVPRDVRIAGLIQEPIGLCGASGHRSVFPAEAPTVIWLFMTDFHEPRDFAEMLDRATETVVVWKPAEAREPVSWPRIDERGPKLIDLGPLADVVEARYEPLAKFGTFEVWGQKAAGKVGTPGAEGRDPAGWTLPRSGQYQ